jgi:hypothetical protein
MVPQWSTHEIALTATGRYANPYTDTAVRAMFHGPDGLVATVQDSGTGQHVADPLHAYPGRSAA